MPNKVKASSKGGFVSPQLQGDKGMGSMKHAGQPAGKFPSVASKKALRGEDRGHKNG